MIDSLIRLSDRTAFGLSIILTVYLALSAVYLFQDVSVFHATYLLGTVIIVAVEYVKIALGKSTNGNALAGRLRIVLSFIVLVVSIAVTSYIVFSAHRLQRIQPFITDLDVIVGWVFIVIILFLVWVHWGTIFTVIIAAGIAYFVWGHLIPVEMLAHPYYDTKFVVSYLGMNATEGFFTFIGLLTDKIYFLVLFATFLLAVGTLNLFMELGKAAGRHVSGGAALPAIVGSSALGAVMGQAVSNVALTGQLTIPMMMKYGFKGSTAGAIEAVASTSGQLIPPILGLAAFMIAAILNIPYIDVALHAVYPAFLYVLGVTGAVLLTAKRQNLGRLIEEVDWQTVYRLMPTFFIPFGIVIALLLFYFSPSLSGLVGIPLVLFLSLFQGRFRRPNLWELTAKLRVGFRLVALLGILAIGIGPFAQVISVTQVASKVGTYFAITLPHNLPFLLFLTMIICMIAGMGLPTPVAYLLVALTVAPFLQELGIPALIAHFFVFYFAIFSTISPPVAISCLAACKLSNAQFLSTCRESLKIAGPTFLIPFSMVYNPSLLEFPKMTIKGLYFLGMTFIVQLVFTIGLGGFFIRRMNTVERFVAVACTTVGMMYLINHRTSFLVLFWAALLFGCLWLFITRKQALTEAVQ